MDKTDWQRQGNFAILNLLGGLSAAHLLSNRRDTVKSHFRSKNKNVTIPVRPQMLCKRATARSAALSESLRINNRVTITTAPCTNRQRRLTTRNDPWLFQTFQSRVISLNSWVLSLVNLAFCSLDAASDYSACSFQFETFRQLKMIILPERFETQKNLRTFRSSMVLSPWLFPYCIRFFCKVFSALNHERQHYWLLQFASGSCFSSEIFAYAFCSQPETCPFCVLVFSYKFFAFVFDFCLQLYWLSIYIAYNRSL